MSPQALRRILGAYFGVLLALCVLVRQHFALGGEGTSGPVVVSWWRGGDRTARQVFPTEADASSELGRQPPGGEVAIVTETVVGRAPLVLSPAIPLLFTVGLVPGRDGVEARLGDKVAYATVDDLLNREAYDRANVWAQAGVSWGTHPATVIAILAEQLEAPAREVAEHATLARVRLVRKTVRPPRVRAERPDRAGTLPRLPSREWPAALSDSDLDRGLVLDGVAEAATYLARSVDDQGTFRYLVDAPKNLTIPGYNWPRHAGATLFVAQAAAVLDDPFIRYAALRAAAKLRDSAMRDCGPHRCIGGEEPIAEIGSSALALLAFSEIVETGADPAYRPAMAGLAEFLRSQQRPDGEMMHLYDRAKKQPLDVQLLYFTGEAALALGRSHRTNGDPRDLDASKRALARLSGKGWSFFGSRYYFSEEHWTCQTVAELWDRAPDPEALAFCSRWHEYQRRLQQDAADTPFDADGAFSFGPIASPRVTPASSRGEAAGALAEVLLREKLRGHHERDDELVLVRRELGRALAFVLRSQFHPGPSHLFADPVAVRGAIPGSPVDWQLRIDYPQHAGSMMLRWLAIDAIAKGPAMEPAKEHGSEVAPR